MIHNFERNVNLYLVVFEFELFERLVAETTYLQGEVLGEIVCDVMFSGKCVRPVITGGGSGRSLENVSNFGLGEVIIVDESWLLDVC